MTTPSLPERRPIPRFEGSSAVPHPEGGRTGAAAGVRSQRFHEQGAEVGSSLRHAARATARRRTMARNSSGTRGDVRKSALWGSGNRGGEFRTNALWGKGGKGTIVLLVMLVLPLLSVAASAKSGSDIPAGTGPTYVEPGLLDRAQANPHQMFRVIVQSTRAHSRRRAPSRTSRRRTTMLSRTRRTRPSRPRSRRTRRRPRPKRKADRDRVRAERAHWKAQREVLKGLQTQLARRPRRELRLHQGRLAGDRRTAARAARAEAGPDDHRGRPGQAVEQRDRRTSGRRRRASCPCSAARRREGSGDRDRGLGHPARPRGLRQRLRIVAQKVITTLAQQLVRGRPRSRHVRGEHRRGQRPGPARRLADLAHRRRRRDGRQRQGAHERRHRGRRVDLREPASYNIRVANFSLHSARPSNFTKDPLDQAVEKLWFGGVVVVAAAGNYGTADGPSGVKFAPGNDPFVITVGAIDLDGSLRVAKHDVPTWSAYGRTLRRLHEARHRGRRPVHGRRDPVELDARRGEAGEHARRRATCASRARRSRRRSSRARRRRSWPGIRTGRPTRSRAR